MNKKHLLTELIGWYGAIGLIAAYALSSSGIVAVTNVWYQVLNVTAALGIVTIALHKKDYQSTVLNVVWAIIGTIALIKILS